MNRQHLTTAQQRHLFKQLSDIANAALDLYSDFDIPDDKLTVMMDLEHAHAQYPLRLDEMLAAATRQPGPYRHADFTHDMLGIRRHMNRETGQLEDCFLPRFAIQ